MPTSLNIQELKTTSQNLYFGGSTSLSILFDNLGNLGINSIKRDGSNTTLNINSLSTQSGSVFSLSNTVAPADIYRITSNSSGSTITYNSGQIRFGTSGLKRFVIDANAFGVGGASWSDTTGGSTFGAVGDVLISNGTNLQPTWSTLNNSAIAAGAGIVYSKLSLSNSIVNADISTSAGIVDTKLATISTASKVSNSATTATTSSTANSIVLRDANGYITNNYFHSTDDVNTGTITHIMAKFGDNYMRSATAARVATFLNGQSMSIVGNATTAGGLSVHSGTNNEANKIVRTDGNGYIQAWVINSSSGNENNAAAPSRVWGSNSANDLYLRTFNPAYVQRRWYAENYPTTYWLENNWDGTYWFINSPNHIAAGGSGHARVQYSDTSSTAYPNNSTITTSTLSSDVKSRIFKAWVDFGGQYGVAVGNNVSLTRSFNVSSVTIGPSNNVRFTVNFAENLGTTNYTWVGNSGGFYWAHALVLCLSTTATSAQFTTVACGNWHGQMGEQQSGAIRVGIL